MNSSAARECLYDRPRLPMPPDDKEDLSKRPSARSQRQIDLGTLFSLLLTPDAEEDRLSRILRAALEQNIRISERGPTGTTLAVNVAQYAKDPERGLRALFAAGADLDMRAAPQLGGLTPLMALMLRSDYPLDAVGFMTRYNRCNFSSSHVDDGSFPLEILLLRWPDIECLSLLPNFLQGARVEYLDTVGSQSLRPLFLAAQRPKIGHELVRLIIEAFPSNKDKLGFLQRANPVTTKESGSYGCAGCGALRYNEDDETVIKIMLILWQHGLSPTKVHETLVKDNIYRSEGRTDQQCYVLIDQVRRRHMAEQVKKTLASSPPEDRTSPTNGYMSRLNRSGSVNVSLTKQYHKALATAFHDVVRSGTSDEVDVFLRRNPEILDDIVYDPSLYGFSPMHLFLKRDNRPLAHRKLKLKILVDHLLYRCDLVQEAFEQKKGKHTVLQSAISDGDGDDVAAVAELLCAASLVKQESLTELARLAVKHNKPASLKYLLQWDHRNHGRNPMFSISQLLKMNAEGHKDPNLTCILNDAGRRAFRGQAH